MGGGGDYEVALGLHPRDTSLGVAFVLFKLMKRCQRQDRYLYFTHYLRVSQIPLPYCWHRLTTALLDGVFFLRGLKAA